MIKWQDRLPNDKQLQPPCKHTGRCYRCGGCLSIGNKTHTFKQRAQECICPRQTSFVEQERPHA